ncbi:unnamed protein product [Sympodiomycopsis kandeliae]
MSYTTFVASILPRLDKLEVDSTRLPGGNAGLPGDHDKAEEDRKVSCPSALRPAFTRKELAATNAELSPRYVDELIITSTNLDTLHTVKAQLCRKFNMEDTQDISIFRGMNSNYNRHEGTLRTHRRVSVDEILLISMGEFPV